MKNADRTAMPNRSQSPDNVFGGLTKREMFAMNAMQALIPVCWDQETLHDYETASDLVKCMMETAVEHADALLAELDK
ncbi:hypothetical protein NVP1191O_39 [Vibrio phage 1.191.O._10N.286.52.B4]|nr:hypothetical protein NVP1191O_39 [Vibrio phage 1.191.O._10N.286.52.B4]